MRTSLTIAAVALVAALSATVHAQAPAPASTPPAPSATAPTEKDPVIATVGGADIRMSDFRAALAGLPDEYRKMPAVQLFPLMQEQLVDRLAVAMLARKEGLERDPAVERAIERSTNAVLENALLHRDIEPLISEDKIKARYDATIASKPGQQEAHARHILVDSEDQAKKIIAQLKGGADFAALAKQYSKDHGASDDGDLGWFKKDAMVAEFSTAVFGMKSGETSQQPVHTQFGWHVIQVLGFRQAPPPSFAESEEQLRQQMIEEGVRKVVAQAREGLKIELFKPDGSPANAAPAAAAPSGSVAKPGNDAPAAGSK
jgi:peptidyl-prolyl cis-trans isomerase C